jgi:hypothetical protein
MFGVHVETAELAVGLTQELDELHVVEMPSPVNQAGLEASELRLLDQAPGLEALHRDRRSTKTSTQVILDYGEKLK